MQYLTQNLFFKTSRRNIDRKNRSKKDVRKGNFKKMDSALRRNKAERAMYDEIEAEITHLEDMGC